MKRTVIILFVITFAFLQSVSISTGNTATVPVPETLTVLSYPRKQPETITIVAGGDVMLGSAYNGIVPKDNPLRYVGSIISQGDIRFANCEGVISDTGTSTKPNKPGYFSFRVPSSLVKYYRVFNLMSLANNHSYDFGKEGADNTMINLFENNIYFAGLKNKPCTVFTVEGVKVGFCAFAPNGYTWDTNFKDAGWIIKTLRKKCDILIVSAHIGAEGKSAEHITRKEEYYYGEDRGNPYSFARKAIDDGADVVLMQGPHVLRAVDVYKNKFIAYSLGNLSLYGEYPPVISALIKIEINKNGNFVKGKIYPLVVTGKGVPVIDKDKKAIKLISALTKEDIPESRVIIDNSGNIILQR
jgi:poly-gamma-glutamate capsule biosynthesis protein CapA/YwtB (metallophosphatase superfamily)